VPERPHPEETIISEEGKPRVGLWIMPDNRVSGAIEHFVRLLVPKDDVLWERAGRCLDAIPQGHRRFPESHCTKAHVHTWLAWQESPGTPLGLAVTKKYFDAEAEHARLLIAWIRRLFEIGKE